MRVKLDAQFMKTQLICPPGKKRIEFVDQNGIPGLYIEVRETSPGHGTFWYRWKGANKRNSYRKLGDSRVISLTQARERAKELKAKLYLGEDPKAEANEKKEALTYTEFFQNHYLPYITKRKRSYRDDEDRFRLRLKAAFGHKRLEDIGRKELQDFHTSLADEGLAPATADHYLKELRYSLNLAVAWGLLDVNPAAKIPLFNVRNTVENYLNDEQLERLLQVLRSDANVLVCRIVLFLLSCGARLSEALTAKWTDVNFETRVLTVRATNSKSKKARSVPLNDSAMEVLNALDSKGKYEYLFVNRETGKPYVTIARVWHRLRKKAGLPHLRLHDLRHSYASFLVNDGQSLFLLMSILGHADPKMTMRYAHPSAKAMRDAANSASTKILDGLKRAG